MSNPNQKKVVFEALTVAYSLEQFPSGKYISVLKSQLGPDQFVEGMEYIVAYIFKSMMVLCPNDEAEKIQSFIENDEAEKLSAIVTELVATNDAVAQAMDNGLSMAAKVIARKNNIEL